MWKTFKAEFKNLYKNKYRFAAWIIILFMPLLYGFLFLSSFWSPFKNTDQLNIVVVSQDTKKDSNGNPIKDSEGNLVLENHTQNFIDILTNKDPNTGEERTNVIKAGSSKYPVNIHDKTSEQSAEEVINGVNSGDYTAAIVVPEGYSKQIDTLLGDLTTASALQSVADLTKWINSQLGIPNQTSFTTEAMLALIRKDLFNSKPIQFYNSFKHNYVGGQMSNMGIALKSTLLAIAIPDSKSIRHRLESTPSANRDFIRQIIESRDLVDLNLIGKLIDRSGVLSNHIIMGRSEGIKGEHDVLNTYGYGLAPYFISIVLWAGALLLAFLFPNKRYITTESTFKNYFGKQMVWIITGWIQVALLFSIISIPGIFGTATYYITDPDGRTIVDSYTINQCINLGGAQQWMLIGFGFFISTVFMIIVQAIVYTLRVADVGLFMVVVLLVLQLAASGGTFPSMMQNKFFQAIHKIIPFSYTVHGIREMFYMTDAMEVLKDVAILLIFPAIFLTLALTTNYIYDKLSIETINNKKVYASFDKETGGL